MRLGDRARDVEPEARARHRVRAVDAAELLGWSNSDAATVFQSATGDFAELERLVKNVLKGEVQECDRRVPNGTGWLHFNR